MEISPSCSFMDPVLIHGDPFYDKDYVDANGLFSSFDTSIMERLDEDDDDLAGSVMNASTRLNQQNDSDYSDMLERTIAETPASSIPTTSDTPTGSELKQRRRAQNRASQQAFRARKEKHIRGLQQQLESLTAKHCALQDHYTEQSKVVTYLYTRIAELSAEIHTTSYPPARSIPGVSHRTSNWNQFSSFDAFTYTPEQAMIQVHPPSASNYTSPTNTNPPLPWMGNLQDKGEDLLASRKS